MSHGSPESYASPEPYAGPEPYPGAASYADRRPGAGGSPVYPVRPGSVPALPAPPGHRPGLPPGEPLRDGAQLCHWGGHHQDLSVLRRAYHRQRGVSALAAVGCFSLFLALLVGAPSFMNRRLAEGLSAGLLLALAQFPAVGLALALYERTARRQVDPLARRLHRHAAVPGAEPGPER
ncbi:DUF485 domain-containing protein [Streptomyces sp. NPDC059785]|uniref:DUF485 domain-containing protein n=1 Tax=unclassified Streptomyces TaxID=2593676 RepID=UPI003648F48C